MLSRTDFGTELWEFRMSFRWAVEHAGERKMNVGEGSGCLVGGGGLASVQLMVKADSKYSFTNLQPWVQFQIYVLCMKLCRYGWAIWNYLKVKHVSKNISYLTTFSLLFCALDIPSRIIAVAKETNQTWWNTCKLILMCLCVQVMQVLRWDFVFCGICGRNRVCASVGVCTNMFLCPCLHRRWTLVFSFYHGTFLFLCNRWCANENLLVQVYD